MIQSKCIRPLYMARLIACCARFSATHRPELQEAGRVMSESSSSVIAGLSAFSDFLSTAKAVTDAAKRTLILLADLDG